MSNTLQSRLLLPIFRDSEKFTYHYDVHMTESNHKAFIVVLVLLVRVTSAEIQWQDIEELAEDYPYVVALLKESNVYICSGTIINQWTVLTSGKCIMNEPRYIVVGLGVLKKNMEANTFKVASTNLHSEFQFDFWKNDPNLMQIYNNIGMVHPNRPISDVIIKFAKLFSAYTDELDDVDLISVGFGKLYNSDAVALQKQSYKETPCMNARWYYCICALEKSSQHPTKLSEGSPLLYGDKLVGVSAIFGSLSTNLGGIRYNIFTITGPYMNWINMTTYALSKRYELVSCGVQHGVLFKYSPILLAIVSTWY